MRLDNRARRDVRREETITLEPHAYGPPGARWPTEVVMKWWKLLLVAVLFAPVIGCEVDADVDDDADAKIKVDVDD